MPIWKLSLKRDELTAAIRDYLLKSGSIEEQDNIDIGGLNFAEVKITDGPPVKPTDE